MRRDEKRRKEDPRSEYMQINSHYFFHFVRTFFQSLVVSVYWYSAKIPTSRKKCSQANEFDHEIVIISIPRLLSWLRFTYGVPVLYKYVTMNTDTVVLCGAYTVHNAITLVYHTPVFVLNRRKQGMATTVVI